MRHLLTTLFLLITGELAAQHPYQALFDHYTLQTAALGQVSIHVTKMTNPRQNKPVLLYLDGSGSMPLFYRRRSNKYASSVPLAIERYAKEYHVVLISKPGIPFFDSLRYDQAGREYYPPSPGYEARYSLAWRAQSAAKAVDWVLRKLPVDRRRVVVVGYSEGAQVAPRVAVLNKKVTHVACFVGNALNQFYDFLLAARLRAEKGEITPEQGQQIVDSLYAQYAAIYRSPGDTRQRWYGATYQKWASFCLTMPLESMVKLAIPILYVAGGRDRNQTILDMDYARLEFLRRNKTNLTYKVYPSCDHYFQEERFINGQRQQADRLDEAQQFALDWVNQSTQ